MKKNKIKMIAVFAILLLAVVGAYFGLSGLSVVDDSPNRIDIPYTCMIPVDCETKMLQDGAATSEDINKFKDTYEIKCISNKCVGDAK